MRLLLDLCVGTTLLGVLREAGHDAVRMTSDPAERADDEILARALREGRVLVTADKDFGQLVFLQNRPHGGVIRLVELPLGEQARAATEAIRDHAEALAAGAFVVVEGFRVRVVYPPGALPGPAAGGRS